MEASIFVEIDKNDIPKAPGLYEEWLSDEGNAGKPKSEFYESIINELANIIGSPVSGVVRAMKSSSIVPGANTASTSYVPTGLSCSVDALSGDKIRIECSGMVNHTAQNIVHFTLKRNGIDITPAGLTGLGVARIDIADGIRALNIDYTDVISESGLITYELFWRCHNSGTAYLGRRPIDTAMMIPTVMNLTVHS